MCPPFFCVIVASVLFSVFCCVKGFLSVVFCSVSGLCVVRWLVASLVPTVHLPKAVDFTGEPALIRQQP